MYTQFITDHNFPPGKAYCCDCSDVIFNKCQTFFTVFYVDFADNYRLGCIQPSNYVFIDRLLRSANYYLGKDITDKFSAFQIDNKCAELNNESSNKGYAPNAVKITSK